MYTIKKKKNQQYIIYKIIQKKIKIHNEKFIDLTYFQILQKNYAKRKYAYKKACTIIESQRGFKKLCISFKKIISCILFDKIEDSIIILHDR